jgi:subtilisin family serine protease
MKNLNLKKTLITGVIALIILVFLGLAYAKKKMVIMKPKYVKGELIVKFKPAMGKKAFNATAAKIKAEKIAYFSNVDAFHLKLPKDMKVEEAIKILKDDPAVEYAEPNYMVYLDYLPNDPKFNEQWGLHNTGVSGGTADADIDAPEAWDKHKGSKKIVVGITDTGIDLKHEDLSTNIWQNPGETPGDGIDNDGNGYVDDVNGYNFADNTPDPTDDHNHGTHVAGIIGAIGDNNIGITGINYKTSMMALKFMKPITCGTFECGASGSSADAAEAIFYAVDNKARVINASWGGTSASSIIRDAIKYADSLGVLFVAAAGNDSQDNDSIPHFPANYGAPPYNLQNVISVASTDFNDNLSSFSDFGKTSVHLAAPGEDILSSVIGGYKKMSGTSMAAPHVTGTAALIWAKYPRLSHYQVKKCILQNVDPIPSLTGKVITNGRLNADKAIQCTSMKHDSAFILMESDSTLADPLSVNDSNNQYIRQIKLVYNTNLWDAITYYGIIFLPVFFILGWKNLIRKKIKK